MSRPLRIDYPNAWHHVMNRARRGQDLFNDKADYQQFIGLLQETTDLFNVKVAAYCLMLSRSSKRGEQIENEHRFGLIP